MANKKDKDSKVEFLKVVYFDEDAAQDYIDITNGGRLDWTTEENKEKIAKIIAEIDAKAQHQTLTWLLPKNSLRHRASSKNLSRNS